MRKALTLIGTAFLIASAATPVMAANAKTIAKAEADLAKALAGRTAGKPVNCINLRDIRSSVIYPGVGITYEVGRTLYVNRPTGANFLGRDDILVTDTHSSQLCSIDIVRLLDRTANFPTGSVGLNKFVPYTKPKS